MAADDTTYQFALTAKECGFIRAMRSVERSIDPSKQPKLHQTLELHVKDEAGDSLGTCDISPGNIVMDFVGAAAAFLTELMKDPNQRKKGMTEVDEGVHLDDRDSVLGSQMQDTFTDLPEQDAGRKTQSWEAIREANIPPCVKEVSFTIRDEDLTPAFREQLQANYSGVIIVTPSTKAAENRVREACAKERPRGVKQMTIELEETEVTENPELERSLRKTYPWALIESKPGPNESRKRARRMTDSDAATPHKPDPIKHIEDFAAYVMEPPSDDEFGYNKPLRESWHRLTYARKFEIAHARAIQNYHGKVAYGGGCSRCAANGYQCKVYLPQLANLAHMAFGHTCQHCRLSQKPCDIPAAIKFPPSTPTGPAALRLDTRNIDHRAEPLDTPPPTTTTVTTPRSLASRITIVNRNRPDDEVPDDELSIIEFAERIDIFRDHRNQKVKSVIHSMYGLLRHKRRVEPFGKHYLTIDQYYENLITLYILTYRRGEYDLAFIVLLRFQNTNFEMTDDLVSIEDAVRAYEYLPNQAPLCRWIAIVYSFLWNTQLQHWDEFVNTHPNVKLKIPTVAKFLHEICYIRDPLTMGGDIAVRKLWCEVHNHAAGTEDQLRTCENMRTEFGHSAEEVARRWNELEIQKAQQTLARLKDDNGLGGAAGPSMSCIGEKRKAEGSPLPRPFKAGRGGRGRGRPRGPSR